MTLCESHNGKVPLLPLSPVKIWGVIQLKMSLKMLSTESVSICFLMLIILSVDLPCVIYCVQEGRSESSVTAGSETCREVPQESQKSPTYVWSLQSTTVSKRGQLLQETFGDIRTLLFNLLYYFLSCRYPFTADQEIPETDWEVYLRETANAIVSQQTPQR